MAEKKALASVPLVKVDPQVDVELGVSTPLPMVGGYDAYYGLSLNGEVPRTGLVPLDELVLMTRRDGQARALLRLLTLPILAALKDAKWVMPKDQEGGEKEVEFANLMFTLPAASGGMKTSLSRLMRKILLALPHGFSVFEEVRTVPEDGPLKGKIVLEELAYRDARTVRFKVDEKGEQIGVQQRTSVAGKTIDVFIAKDKMWYYACNEEENPFYGVSQFEAAWQHYDIKRKLYYIAHLAAQFAAIPARVGTVPKDASAAEIAQFRTSIENFALNTAMVQKDGFTTELKTGGGQFDFLKLIDHQNHMMSRSVLAGFLDTEDRPALVDIANKDPQADMFILALETIMEEIAEGLSMTVMPKYMDWNFGTQIYPEFKWGPLTDDMKETLVTAFTSVVVSSTLNCTPEFVREVEKKLAAQLNLDIDYDEIEKMEKEAAEQAQEQAQAMAEQEAVMAQQAGPGGPTPPPGGPSAGSPPGPLPPQAGPPGAIAASNQYEYDQLVEMAQKLLSTHLEQDLLPGLVSEDG